MTPAAIRWTAGKRLIIARSQVRGLPAPPNTAGHRPAALALLADRPHDRSAATGRHGPLHPPGSWQAPDSSGRRRHPGRLLCPLRTRGGKDGRPLKASTVHEVHAVLSAALKQAVAWGWIGHIFEVVEQPRAVDAGKRGWANLPA